MEIKNVRKEKKKRKERLKKKKRNKEVNQTFVTKIINKCNNSSPL